jgi:hypothetical protein
LKKIIFFIFLLSCSKEVKYSKEKMLSLALKKDASVSLILPKSMTEGVTCAEYGEGCLGAHIVAVQNIQMIGVEFTDEASAKRAAKLLRGYYAHNWMFDDVTGEPTLEKFVISAFEAKKAIEDPVKK